jgi:hypothetical protein
LGDYINSRCFLCRQFLCRILYLRFIPSLIRGCIQKFPDWTSGARTAYDTALCH